MDAVYERLHHARDKVARHSVLLSLAELNGRVGAGLPTGHEEKAKRRKDKRGDNHRRCGLQNFYQDTFHPDLSRRGTIVAIHLQGR